MGVGRGGKRRTLVGVRSESELQVKKWHEGSQFEFFLSRIKQTGSKGEKKVKQHRTKRTPVVLTQQIVGIPRAKLHQTNCNVG